MLLQKINKKIASENMRLRVKKIGVIDYLCLGSKEHVCDDVASCMIKDMSLAECVDNLKIKTKTTIKVSKLVKVMGLMKEVIDEHERRNHN